MKHHVLLRSPMLGWKLNSMAKEFSMQIIWNFWQFFLLLDNICVSRWNEKESSILLIGKKDDPLFFREITSGLVWKRHFFASSNSVYFVSKARISCRNETHQIEICQSKEILRGILLKGRNMVGDFHPKALAVFRFFYNLTNSADFQTLI